MVALYVDDMIIFSNEMRYIDNIIEYFKGNFGIVDLGEPRYCLGIEIFRDRKNIKFFINQSTHIMSTVKKFGLEECKDVRTPAETKQVLSKGDDTEDEVYPYRELVGSLMYIMIGSRPDIAHSTSSVSKYCDCYKKEHWIAAKRILKYLKTTHTYGILYDGNSKFNITGFADANWASDIDTRKIDYWICVYPE